VSRRMALAAALAGLAALAAAPAASAADQTVQAVDGTPADNFNNRWSPQNVTIAVGETVTWSFAGTTGLHNVESRGSNWDFTSGNPATAPPPASFTFAAPGTYRFVCLVHENTMYGDVFVTDESGEPPPPPPPPPPSEQPFPNEQSPPAVDEQRPGISRLRAAARRRGARVRFRLSETARVTVKVKRAGVTVARRSVKRRRGLRRVYVGGLAAGRRYRIEVRATDLGGNRSRVRRTRLRT